MSSQGGTSVIAMVTAEPIVRALYEQGLTQQAAQAIINNPTIAWKTAQAAKAALAAETRDTNYELRREVLATPIEECAIIDKRTRNILRRFGVITIGDLALHNDTQLRYTRGIGDKSRSDMDKLIADYGLDAFCDGTYDEKLVAAATLYGGVEYVPAKHLKLWQLALDNFTVKYLMEHGSLGELVTTSAQDYLDWRQHRCGSNEHTQAKLAQLEHIRTGLSKAGLALRGE